MTVVDVVTFQAFKMIAEFFLLFGFGLAASFDVFELIPLATLLFFQIKLIVKLLLSFLSSTRIVASFLACPDFVASLGFKERPPPEPPDEFQFVCFCSILISNRSRSLFDC